ncbi:hypothetical protein FACS1894152_2190 [Bacilli bacterium]|nr:hypothetical protein FACS1894152_2190 [Bacilli bacterium]
MNVLTALDFVANVSIFYFIAMLAMDILLVYKLYGFKNKVTNYLLFLNATFVMEYWLIFHCNYNWRIFNKSFPEFLGGGVIISMILLAINIFVFIKFFANRRITKLISTILLIIVVFSTIYPYYKNHASWAYIPLYIVEFGQPFIQLAYMAIFTLYLLSKQIVMAVR